MKKRDEASPSIILAGRAILVKMLKTLEPRYAFDSNFEYFILCCCFFNSFFLFFMFVFFFHFFFFIFFLFIFFFCFFFVLFFLIFLLFFLLLFLNTYVV